MPILSDDLQFTIIGLTSVPDRRWLEKEEEVSARRRGQRRKEGRGKRRRSRRNQERCCEGPVT